MRASPRFQYLVTASPTHPGAITLCSLLRDLHPLPFTATSLPELQSASGTELPTSRTVYAVIYGAPR